MSDVFSIKEKEIVGKSRKAEIVEARQTAMYLSRSLIGDSLSNIGVYFGGRDHTTVMHAVKKIEELRQTDLSFSEDVDLLRRLLEG